MQDCIYDCSDYYIKTFDFIQNSGMGKSKLADAFDKSYFIINFIFYENDGYLSSDTKILQFIFLESPDEVKEFANKSSQKKLQL